MSGTAETMLDDRPRDAQALLVYADWLQQRGDPRGELIALQAAGDPASLAAARKLMAQHAERLVPPHLHVAETLEGLELGFLRRLVLAARDLRIRGNDWRSLIAHPSMRYLESLAVDFTYEGGAAKERAAEVKGFVGSFEVARFPALRSLRLTALGPPSSPATLTPIFAACPKLEELTLEGHAGLGWMKLAELRSLAIDLMPPRRFDRTAWHHLARPLAKAVLPSLRTLSARWGLFAALDRERWGHALVSARVLDSRGVDEVCEGLAGTRVFAHVDSLAFEGEVSERGITALISARESLSRIKHITLRGRSLTEGDVRRLESAFGRAVVVESSP